MTIKEYQLEIEKMLMYIHNSFCVNHIDSVKKLFHKYIMVKHIENKTEIDLIDEFKSIYNELKPHYCQLIEDEKSVNQLLGKAFESAVKEIFANHKPPKYHIIITDWFIFNW